jgi:very-short-patch-repair endonuclease
MPAVQTKRARQLRKSLTPQEAKLWRELRLLKSQGYHFRRQAPFKGYYLDFVCFRSRLVVEVDGGQHGESEQAKHDEIRDAVLLSAGFETLRFWNSEVNTNLDGVVYSILCTLDAIEGYPTRPALRAVHPPHEGEGG